MVDINNSQDYDAATRQEILAESVTDGQFLQGYMELAKAEKVELDDPVAFYLKTFGDRPLWRFVLTHPDLDHMRGLKKLFENVEVFNFWDTANTKPTPKFRSAADREDWEFYQSLRANSEITKFYTRDDQRYAFNLDEAGNLGGDRIHLLSPTTDLVDECNRLGRSNDLSLALWIEHAGNSLLLPGDAEALAWDKMVEHYGNALSSTVLKASHHGRDSGFNLEALKRIDPAVVVLSVGRKPNTDAHRKYSYHCARTRSTRRHGTINLIFHDDGSREWFVDRNWDV